MERSEQINDLAAALAKAQATFVPVSKTGNNPFLKSKYVTLDSIIEMTRKPLSDAGLSYTQMLDADGEGLPVLTTMLMHSSGQWLSSGVIVRAISGKGTNELQELGRSITYMKRYALAAMLGVSSDEDTDGHGAKSTPKRQQKQTSHKPAKPVANLPTDTFASQSEAIKWGVDQGVFDHGAHAANAYVKCKETHNPATAAEMGKLWRADVVHRVLVKAAREYPYGPDKLLGACGPGQLRDLLSECDEKKDAASIERATHLVVLIDHLAEQAPDDTIDEKAINDILHPKDELEL